jgi:hypothetical protein
MFNARVSTVMVANSSPARAPAYVYVIADGTKVRRVQKSPPSTLRGGRPEPSTPYFRLEQIQPGQMRESHGPSDAADKRL